jgi:hypothetical protein
MIDTKLMSEKIATKTLGKKSREFFRFEIYQKNEKI